MVGRTTGNEASDAEYQSETKPQRNFALNLRTDIKEKNYSKRISKELLSHKSGRNEKFGLFTHVFVVNRLRMSTTAAWKQKDS